MPPVLTAPERRLLFLTSAGHFSIHFFELMFPTAAVLVAHETGAPVEQVLGWSFAGYLLYGVGSLPAGVLADRIGARRLLAGAFVAVGGAALAIGVSTPGWALVLSLGCLGLASSVYHPVAFALISQRIRATGRALGITGTFGNLGVAVGPATGLLMAVLGWRGAYLAMAGLPLLLGLAILRAPLEPGRGPGPPDTGARSRPGAAPVGGAVVLLYMATMLGGVVYRGGTVVQPAYFAQHVPGFDYGTIAVLVSLVYSAGMVGQYVGGILTDRYDVRWVYGGFHAGSLVPLLVMARAEGAVLVFAAAVFVFFSLGMQPAENSLIALCTPHRWRSTGYGLKFVLTFGVGALVVPVVASGQTGAALHGVFYLLAGVVAALVAVIALFTRRTAHLTLRAGLHEPAY